MKTRPRLRLAHRLRAINEIPNINSGGCGIVAHALAQHINNTYPNKAQVVYIYEYQCSTFYALHEGRPASCNHALVLFRGKYYDSEGSFTKKQVKEEGAEHFVPISLELSEQCITKGKHWNTMFNKKKYIPIIQDIFKEA